MNILKDPLNNPLIIRVNEKLNSLEENYSILHDDYNKTKLKILGSDPVDVKKDFPGITTLYSVLKVNVDKIKLIADGVNRVQNRVENINNEVMNKVKKDLNGKL